MQLGLIAAVVVIATFWTVDEDWHRTAMLDAAYAGRGYYGR